MDYKRFFTNQLLQRLSQPDLNFLQVLIGPRQVGKSTAAEQIAAQWNASQILVNADGVTPPKADWIEHHWNRARQMPGPVLLIIDEIQKVEGWSETVKTLFDKDRRSKHLRVLLSGSASLKLQRGLGDSLAGRFELSRAPHWGFDECREVFGWDFTTFLKFGGYPSSAALIQDLLRWQQFLRDGIIEPVLGKDIQSMTTVQKPALLRQLFELAMHYPAQEISFQKLLGQLQDRGNATTIKHYLEILSGAFLLQTLEKFSARPLSTKASSPKIVPLCSALIHAFNDINRVDNDPEWRGRIFEAAIGAHLLRLPGQLYYWREGKFEVDYVYVENNAVYAFEVKSGRKKNSDGLKEFNKKFPKAHCTIVDAERGQKFLGNFPSLSHLKSS